MNHTFSPSAEDKSKCSHPYPWGPCNMDMFSHTALAVCKSCGKRGECGLYGPDKLMCWDCKDKEVGAVIDKVKESTEKSRLAKELLEKSQATDDKMEFNGSFYLAETTDLMSIKKAINENDEIPSDEKSAKMQDMIVERINKFAARVFVIDNEKFELQNRLNADYKTLRDFGIALREEYRNKIKEHDSNYKPAAAIKVKVDKKLKDKTNTDRLIEAIMQYHNLDREQARIKVMEMQREKDAKLNAMDKVVKAYMELHPGVSKEEALENIRKGTNQ